MRFRYSGDNNNSFILLSNVILLSMRTCHVNTNKFDSWRHLRQHVNKRACMSSQVHLCARSCALTCCCFIFNTTNLNIIYKLIQVYSLLVVYKSWDCSMCNLAYSNIQHNFCFSGASLVQMIIIQIPTVLQLAKTV